MVDTVVLVALVVDGAAVAVVVFFTECLVDSLTETIFKSVLITIGRHHRNEKRERHTPFNFRLGGISTETTPPTSDDGQTRFNTPRAEMVCCANAAELQHPAKWVQSVNHVPTCTMST